MPNIELTPALTCMYVIARTTSAVYLRLPRELQRDTNGCLCAQCKANPELAKWDTLVVPTIATRGNEHSYTVHMPSGSIEAFKAYMAKKGELL